MFSHAKGGELEQNNMLLARVFLFTPRRFLYMPTSKSAGLHYTSNSQRVIFNLPGPLPRFTVVVAPTAASACTDSTGPGSAILRDLPRLSCGWAGFASITMLLEAGTSLEVTLVSAVEVVTLTFLGAGAVGGSISFAFLFFPVVDGVDSRVAFVTPFFNFGRALGCPFGAVMVADVSVASSKLGSILFLRLVDLGAVPPPTISWVVDPELVLMSSVTAIVDFLSVTGPPVLDPSCESTVSRESCNVGESSGAGAFFFPLARAFGFGRGFETAFGTEGIKTSVSTPIFSGIVAICWSTSRERFEREGPAIGRISWVCTVDTAPGVELDDLLSSLFNLSYRIRHWVSGE